VPRRRLDLADVSVDNTESFRRRGLWGRWFVRAAVVGLIAGAGVGVWLAYRGVSVSIQAENNLHATLFAVHLVEHFVSVNGRWPNSWAELEDTPLDDDLHGQSWPAVSRELQRRVEIDFRADPKKVGQQDPRTFTAVRPIGPYYEYRDCGAVLPLPTPVRKSIKGAAEQ